MSRYVVPVVAGLLREPAMPGTHTLKAVFTFCNRYLTEKEAVAAVGYTHRAYAIAAWRFLTKTGFINFGVAPGMSAKQSSSSEPPKGTVVVVGSGMAGMQAIFLSHDAVW